MFCFFSFLFCFSNRCALTKQNLKKLLNPSCNLRGLNLPSLTGLSCHSEEQNPIQTLERIIRFHSSFSDLSILQSHKHDHSPRSSHHKTRRFVPSHPSSDGSAGARRREPDCGIHPVRRSGNFKALEEGGFSEERLHRFAGIGFGLFSSFFRHHGQQQARRLEKLRQI